MKRIQVISLAVVPAVTFFGLMLAWQPAKKAEAAGPLQRFGVRPIPRDRDRQQLLEAVGSMAASHYYQTYLNIGFLADGKAKGLYGDKEAKRVLDSLLSVHATVDKQLDTVAKLDLEKDDQTSLNQMRKLSSQIRDQGKELQAYWETGDRERYANYQDLRRQSWAGVSQLLGLDQ